MSLLKDEVTSRLDELHKTGAEALVLYRDLEGRIDDPALGALVARQVNEQTRLLDLAADLRRARGELPHAGDPERSHLEAAGAFVRAVVLPGDAAGHYVESLLHAAEAVERQVEAALGVGLDVELRRLLEAFRAANADFRAALRGRL